MKTPNLIVAGLTLALLSILNPQLSTCHAAPGDLDTTFAGTGKSRIGFGGAYAVCSAVAAQPDGKLILAGSGFLPYHSDQSYILLARLDTNNVLDTSFGGDGKVVTQVSPNAGSRANAVAVQADGKIVVAGNSSQNYGSYFDFTLVRYNPDGSLDTTFGTNGTGIVYTDFGDYSTILALAIQPDGKIVVAGQAPSSAGNSFALARYQTNGTLDETFGSGGKAVSTDSQGFLNGLMLQSDGKIVAAGYLFSSGGYDDLAVLRYTTNGVLDTAFGGGGTGEVFPPIYSDVGLSPYNPGVALQQGGITVGNPDKIVVFGAEVGGTFAVARLNLDGSLDTTFGNGGIVTNALSSGFAYEYAQAVLIQKSYGPLGTVHILVAGSADNTNSSTTEFLLARYNGDGSPDTSFGPNGNGKEELSFGAGHFDMANALAFQAGKVVGAGVSYANSFNSDFAAARFNGDGSLDPAFGNGGVVTLDLANNGAEAQSVAIQPDGKIVVVGDASNGVENIFAVARYKPDGLLDATFNADGKVTTMVGSSNSLATAVALQPDGKIVAAGYAYTYQFLGTVAADYVTVVRYNVDGSLDTSFGSAGEVSFGVTGLPKALAIQPDGKIVAAGYAYNGANDDFEAVRFTTNGVRDNSFGDSGVVTTSVAGGEDQAWAVQIQKDGKIVLAGSGQVGSATNFALVRYNSDGSLDNSFGSFGRTVTDFGGTGAQALAMTIQPDGKLIAAGVAASNGVNYIALARYTTNGVLDPSFGAGGKVLTQVGLVNDYGAALAQEPDGKILVAGASQQGANDEYTVVRYTPDGSLDYTCGIGGKVVVSFNDGGSDFGAAVALDQIGRAVVVGNANDLFGVTRLTSEPFLKITSLTQIENGIALLKGLGVPEANHTLWAAPDLTPGGFSPLDSVTPDAGGFWEYQDTNTVGLGRRFYRLSYP